MPSPGSRVSLGCRCSDRRQLKSCSPSSSGEKFLCEDVVVFKSVLAARLKIEVAEISHVVIVVVIVVDSPPPPKKKTSLQHGRWREPLFR